MTPPLCPQCGTELYGDSTAVGICIYHTHAEDWAAANRIFCDWLHRSVEPPQAPLAPIVEYGWAG